MSELLKEFHKMNIELAVIAGIYRDDRPVFLPDTIFYPVYFNEGELPFPIVGMSDEMPYRSMRYCDMNRQMVLQFKSAFSRAVRAAAAQFCPDMILCHHLYLMTAVVREALPDHLIYGFSHNTDIRQIVKTDLERAYIVEQIRKLNHVFVLREENQKSVEEIFDIPEEQITIVGGGYNKDLFYPPEEERSGDMKRVIFAGKISKKKGVESLVRSLAYMDYLGEVEFLLAGGAGNEEEYEEIRTLSKDAKYPVRFLGKLPQEKLADIYRTCDVFVLPSFCEGLPLSVIEALACGCRIVMTKLPGMEEWMKQHVKNGNIRFVSPPRLENMDEPNIFDLPEFERKLSDAVGCALRDNQNTKPDVSGLSWHKIAEKVLGL